MTRCLSVSHFSTMTRLGGVEQMLLDLLLASPQTTVCHSLLTTSSSANVLAPLRSTTVAHFQPHKRFPFDPIALLQMRQWLKKHSTQLIHAYNAYAHVWAGVVSRLAQTPTLVTGEHGTIWRTDGLLFWLDRWVQRQADGIVANSHASATLLQQRYGIASNKIQVVHNAIPDFPIADRNKIRAEWGLADKLIVGSVGRLDTPKDYRTLIDTAVLLHQMRPNVHFIIIGGGPQEAYLHEYAQQQNVASFFHFTGWQSDARRLMQAFDLFVSTSIHETFGNALAEASLAATAIIAPQVDGIPEVVLDGETGILLTPTEPVYTVPLVADATPYPPRVLIEGQLCPPRSLNPTRLAETIAYLLDDADLRAYYGQNGHRRVQTQFNINRYKTELENYYLYLHQHKTHV